MSQAPSMPGIWTLQGHGDFSRSDRTFWSISYGHCIASRNHSHWNMEENAPHDDVIKWKHFPRNWPFVRGIHWSPVNPPHKGQCRGALMFSLICVWINGWVNNHEAGDLRRYHTHYEVIVMQLITCYIAAVKQSTTEICTYLTHWDLVLHIYMSVN